MNEKILKFNNTRLNKKEFHKSKEPIDLMSVIVDQIVVSDKFKHNNEGFKYFIGYLEGGIVKWVYKYFGMRLKINQALNFIASLFMNINT